ncbi:MAG: deoxyribodipyrimidine photolyase [Acidobacteria bacterium]|nr:MAG: deoxyribodipyrimidine photolyase [Acidobacteriota bacterium]REK02927.1 MAG: deoxyribodipyrimidine photolyase [Acidobacteriota bacterium]REK13269.1 MAG: deoxyribodipyrimidine photolyase [Acidobacteriota bacterium]REK41263.1 MAG: deoxyribodipyrimidine photolyase [Acidobacteriota bacterium]
MERINERVVKLNDADERQGADYVLYWMQMYKRADHNHALNFAIEKANDLGLPLLVYEGLKFYYPWASDRLHTFILEGVEEKRDAFKDRGISYVFYLQKDDDSPKQTVKAVSEKAALVVTDDYPCFIIPEHNRAICEKSEVAVYAVDSNGIIPMSKFEKENYAAYTIRPKINKILDEYFVTFEEIEIGNKDAGIDADCPDTDCSADKIEHLVSECDIDHSVPASLIYKGGTENARERLRKFVEEILPTYDKTRNKCEIDGSSRLSSYLHFGFLSSIEAALAAREADAPEDAKDEFLEELIVRRELSFNFTKFNDKYDSLESLPDWARETMREHADDEREYTYTAKELENAETHDDLWNAAQREIVETGEMHNYVRMLWGKNVIAWTKTYEEAFDTLVHLNNKYGLDGRDPNSYAGILWCFGKHDRPWFERDVFGKMRYMTSNSTGKKFGSKQYIEWTKSLKDDPSLPATYEE